MAFARSALNWTCSYYADGLCPADVPWYFSYKPSLVDGFSDAYLALAAPVLAYWFLSLTFHYLDTREWKALERYRIHDSAEVASRNTVTRSAVVQAVIFQQIVQTMLGLMWMGDDHTAFVNHPERVARIARYISVISGGRGADLTIRLCRILVGDTCGSVLVGFLIDTWQYFCHRYMHMNKFLYRHFHSWHHRLYVPYAFGALYNHPVEGFFLDSLGTVVAEALSFMTTRQAALLFTIATFKTVDDHCGYRFPYDPLQMMSKNNADYHDIHHQKIGIKSNFAQPFYVHWDYLLGTQMTRSEMEARRAKLREKME
ncbi:Sphingosine hydroxylase [Mycena kentingensis (nom. inval.)]|nr:Sphingosine hydroxylase [Mycena kentingensis (nom. inval.)]